MTRTMIAGFGLLLSCQLLFGQQVTIPVETADNVILLQTDRDQRLQMIYFGEPLKQTEEYAAVVNNYRYFDTSVGTYNGAYPPAGTWNMAEPAVQVVHADGNQSLDLKYVSHTAGEEDDGSMVTRVTLQDPVYPFSVTLCFKAWKKENVIEQWAEIEHEETGPVLLKKFASANLYIAGESFYLTTYQGSWAQEMQPAETRLERGIRSVDTRLGTRAMLLQSPSFILSLDQPAAENQGNVLVGQLAWSGN
ncbi:MAG: glycoside hydrolase family 36 N-terminal domain-containing protein, partial [Bacteroidales bacterium]